MGVVITRKRETLWEDPVSIAICVWRAIICGGFRVFRASVTGVTGVTYLKTLL